MLEKLSKDGIAMRAIYSDDTIVNIEVQNKHILNSCVDTLSQPSSGVAKITYQTTSTLLEHLEVSREGFMLLWYGILFSRLFSR